MGAIPVLYVLNELCTEDWNVDGKERNTVSNTIAVVLLGFRELDK